ncbi:MAG: two-component system response regulator [Curvibacter sp. RIFCSPHIGHO2_12_FULL_63_18]|uniref:HD domain-containing phosphohydrolase n=1 Tax=Rhodoferax sp. TaxID=50421 RepID=UPI0008D68708|nr:HD domain-containing phosphohydrolase [Rhodoferax sp.]OGO96571.1 MAG: two-component system response regulator [Curvibacter sp. GWA2_63_95]OGP00293.1 MAG: two-component system response regulator [Curvibacter sp. RIFCSPHIGHO2_12_FULL_63_18]HCX82768.1 two-component system response regulator [Rhodoferax sp.]
MQHVLIVDDAPATLALLIELVEKLGDCRAIPFASPVQALGWAERTAVDLVTVDYTMEGMDGLEFIRRFRQIPGRDITPIMMVTANDQKPVRYRALDAGANDFMAKPVDRVEFLARAKNLLILSDARTKLADRAAWLAEEVHKATAEILARERDTVIRLSRAAEFRDPETGAHISRMAHYSRLIAKGLNLSEAEQDLLLEAAPMHDIGKVGIADNILLKPGRLSEAEFAIMKQHAVYGYELLQGSASRVLQTGAEIALGHHEKFDGSGYPQGLKGEAIPLFSRIVAVADVFDALTSERPYKKAWTLEAAVDFLLAGSGTHFDPRCVQSFLNAWDEVLAVRERYADAEESRLLPIL